MEPGPPGVDGGGVSPGGVGAVGGLSISSVPDESPLGVGAGLSPSAGLSDGFAPGAGFASSVFGDVLLAMALGSGASEESAAGGRAALLGSFVAA